jgi:hypothetical protein
VAGRQRGKSGGARARGLRTLQHQTLSASVRYAIDTEVWLRGLLLAREGERAPVTRWATKDQVHDEALGWFLQRHAHQPLRDYPARRAGDSDLTFWLDSRLIERARRMAARDGIRLARLIDAALTGYARAHIPAEIIQFRQRVQAEAQKLYASLRGAVPGGATPRTRKTMPEVNRSR